MSIPFQLRFERDLEVLETRMNQIAASDQFYTGHDLRHVARMASILRNRMKEYNNAKERFSEELRESRAELGLEP